MDITSPILKVREHSDDDIPETTSNLVVRRRRSHREVYSNTSEDKKQILIKCYEEGNTIIEASEIAGIKINTAKSIINRYKKDGCIILNRNRNGKRKVKLSEEIIKKIEEMVKENPSITLKNIKVKIIEFTNVSLSTLKLDKSNYCSS